MESPKQDARVGVVLNGRYRITELLGEGGMGLVYRGERLQLGRPVAIKFLHLNYAKSPKFVARFEREARAMSKLSHPYCVSVIDFGVHDEPYIVMDFVVGDTLRQLMDDERIAPQRAVQITRQILAGLAHAHDQGVIHRDIKPGNVMVGAATGMGDHVRIFDFGLAKLHDATVEGDHSVATVIGTPAYMAPEQTRAEPIDARADLYATGILLFEMLTGEKPFTGEDAYAVIRKQREEPPPSVKSLAPLVSSELAQVVARALEKDREHRYQSATEFVAALDAVPEASGRTSTAAAETATGTAELPRTQSTPTESVSAELSTRSRLVAFMGLALVTAVGGFVYVTTRSPDRSVTEYAAQPAAQAPRAQPSQEPVPQPSEPALAPSHEPLAEASLAPSEGPSDGGLEGEAALEEALEQASRALDESGEQEITLLTESAREVRTISDVHKLIGQGEIDEAIYGLHVLRDKSPYNPYYPFLLGDLYCERGFFGDGLAKYREALRLSDGYKKRASIQANAIRALGNDATRLRAHVLLERDLGKDALPALEAAANNLAEPELAERARLIAGRIAR